MRLEFKLISGYLLVGMLLAGIAHGAHLQECPQDVSRNVDGLWESVLFWPMIFAVVAAAPRGLVYAPCHKGD